jgi:N-acyl-phosphatidylethanolamine-hydrolysing phospholipase D
MGPDDAVKAHIDLKSPATSVGIHWGTFMMSDEHYLKPRQKLMECFESTDESRFITTFLGDTLLLN